MIGNYNEQTEKDCPQGESCQYYPPETPETITLAQRDDDLWFARLPSNGFAGCEVNIVRTAETYERDAKALVGHSVAEIMRRLGVVNGNWVAYSKVDGKYISDSKTREPHYAALQAHGIVPQSSEPETCAPSASANESRNGTAGVTELCTSSASVISSRKVTRNATTGLTEEYLQDHPEEDRSVPVGFVCKTLEDCKRCAIAFADAVG